jgi:4-amino-4-deoxy-L-arabinose transferase-like glycosyltransferase
MKTLSHQQILILLALGGILIRIIFCFEFPAPFIQPDTASYMMMTHSLLLDETMDIHEQRPPSYPVFMAAILTVVPDYFAIIIFQHLLGFFACLMWLSILRTYHTERVWLLYAGTAAIFLNPAVVSFEHTLLSDFLLAFWVACLAYLIFLYNRWQQWMLLIPVGIIIGLAVLTKPAAWILLLLAAVGIFPLIRKRILFLRVAGRVGVIVIFAAVSIVPYSIWHGQQTGFFGITKGSSITTFGNMAQWIVLDSAQHHKYKDLIREDIQFYRETYGGWNPAWILYSENSPAKKIRAAAPTEREYYRILKDLTREAILHHPHLFLARGILQTVIALGAPDFPAVIHPGKGGVVLEWSNRSLLHHNSIRILDNHPFVDFQIYGGSIQALKEPDSFSWKLSDTFAWVHLLLLILPIWLIPIYTVGYIGFLIRMVVVRAWYKLDWFLVILYFIPLALAGVSGFLGRGMGRLGLPFWSILIIFTVMVLQRWKRRDPESSISNHPLTNSAPSNTSGK